MNDDLAGGSRGADDVLRGTEGADRLFGRLGDDRIDGGDGPDVSVYTRPRDAYVVDLTQHASGRIVVTGPDGRHLLDNVERLEFADHKLAFDLGTGQAGANTARLVAAAFTPNAVHALPDYIGIGLQLFDAGHNMLQVAQLAATVLGLDDDAFIDRIYLHVVGLPPTQAAHDFFESLLQGHGGNLTQADLLVLAANHEMTAEQIGLVGLAQSGLEYA